MLRQLAGYYQKEPDSLFMVRIAQGMVHMGKGTIGLNFHHKLSIISKHMIELFQYIEPFTDPLFRPTPSTRPFGGSSRVPNHHKTLTLAFFDTQDGVSMGSN